MDPQPQLCPHPHKRKYSSKKAAKGGRKGQPRYLIPYSCRCGYWHLGSTKNTKRYKRAVKAREEARQAALQKKLDNTQDA